VTIRVGRVVELGEGEESRIAGDGGERVKVEVLVLGRDDFPLSSLWPSSDLQYRVRD
jgi:hypothetical protein